MALNLGDTAEMLVMKLKDTYGRNDDDIGTYAPNMGMHGNKKSGKTYARKGKPAPDHVVRVLDSMQTFMQDIGDVFVSDEHLLDNPNAIRDGNIQTLAEIVNDYMAHFGSLEDETDADVLIARVRDLLRRIRDERPARGARSGVSSVQQPSRQGNGRRGASVAMRHPTASHVNNNSTPAGNDGGAKKKGARLNVVVVKERRPVGKDGKPLEGEELARFQRRSEAAKKAAATRHRREEARKRANDVDQGEEGGDNSGKRKANSQASRAHKRAKTNADAPVVVIDAVSGGKVIPVNNSGSNDSKNESSSSDSEKSETVLKRPTMRRRALANASSPNSTCDEDNEDAHSAPNASADSAPNASADSAPNASADSAPNASANSAPNASANSAPNASANLAPNASANSAPNASANSAPNASANLAPNASAAANLAPNATVDSVPSAPAPARSVRNASASEVVVRRGARRVVGVGVISHELRVDNDARLELIRNNHRHPQAIEEQNARDVVQIASTPLDGAESAGAHAGSVPNANAPDSVSRSSPVNSGGGLSNELRADVDARFGSIRSDRRHPMGVEEGTARVVVQVGFNLPGHEESADAPADTAHVKPTNSDGSGGHVSTSSRAKAASGKFNLEVEKSKLNSFLKTLQTANYASVMNYINKHQELKEGETQESFDKYNKEVEESIGGYNTENTAYNEAVKPFLDQFNEAKRVLSDYVSRRGNLDDLKKARNSLEERIKHVNERLSELIASSRQRSGDVANQTEDIIDLSQICPDSQPTDDGTTGYSNASRNASKLSNLNTEYERIKKESDDLLTERDEKNEIILAMELLERTVTEKQMELGRGSDEMRRRRTQRDQFLNQIRIAVRGRLTRLLASREQLERFGDRARDLRDSISDIRNYITSFIAAMDSRFVVMGGAITDEQRRSVGYALWMHIRDIVHTLRQELVDSIVPDATQYNDMRAFKRKLFNNMNDLTYGIFVRFRIAYVSMLGSLHSMLNPSDDNEYDRSFLDVMFRYFEHDAMFVFMNGIHRRLNSFFAFSNIGSDEQPLNFVSLSIDYDHYGGEAFEKAVSEQVKQWQAAFDERAEMYARARSIHDEEERQVAKARANSLDDMEKLVSNAEKLFELSAAKATEAALVNVQKMRDDAEASVRLAKEETDKAEKAKAKAAKATAKAEKAKAEAEEAMKKSRDEHEKFKEANSEVTKSVEIASEKWKQAEKAKADAEAATKALEERLNDIKRQIEDAEKAKSDAEAATKASEERLNDIKRQTKDAETAKADAEAATKAAEERLKDIERQIEEAEARLSARADSIFNFSQKPDDDGSQSDPYLRGLFPDNGM